LVELALYIPLLFFCMQAFGILGAAMAWTARVAVDFVALMYFAKQKGY